MIESASSLLVRSGKRRSAFYGASISALVLAIGTPGPTAAQSFQGTGSVTSGSASIVNGAGTTDVLVSSNEVIIDWTTTDPGGTGNVVFQPGGTTATFSASSIPGTDYTVLNRIVPVDGTGNPTASTIQFNGTVNSTLFGATGGNVWFYSPNGVIVGSTAQFNVGGLVLTTNPIDTTGGLYGPSGQIRFAGAAGSLAPVTIQSGAQINALLNPMAPANAAYVALVAPRIEQAGTVRSDGSIAYVAAEVADITINAGLFDINVTTGTTDAEGINHTGTTSGSASTSSTDLKTIYMVAIGKNDGLTMMLNGGIGYDAAAVATNDGSAVILSAGHGMGFDTGNPLTAPANIAIGDAQFSSVTTANASDTITVAPTGTTTFDRFTTLNAVNRVEINALGGAQIIANDTTGVPADLLFPPFGIAYALDVNAGYGGQGGTVALNIDGGGALTAAGRVRLRAIGDANSTGSLTLDGVGGALGIAVGNGTLTANRLELDASGYGQNPNIGTGGNGTGGTISLVNSGTVSVQDFQANANGYGGSGNTGGNGFGGVIQITATGGGTYTSSGFDIDASADGGDGSTLAGGNGFGGQIDVLVDTGGTLGTAASFYADTSGGGGNSPVQGGNGTGGAITVTDNGGLLDFNNAGLYSIAYGAGSDGNGGDAFGGTALLALHGNAQSWGSLVIDASTHAGESFLSGFSGSATGDIANGAMLDIQGGSLDLAFYLEVHADAFTAANTDLGDFARAGRAAVNVGGGGALTTASDTYITANATFEVESSGTPATFTPNMIAGNATLAIDNGTVSLPSLSVEAYAETMGGPSGAGTATGGTATVSVANGGSLTVDSALASSSIFQPGLHVNASASGAYSDPFASPGADQYGSAAQGGTASLLLTGGTIDVADATVVEAQGTGGLFTSVGGANSLGSGTGGMALVSVGGGTMTLASTLDVLANGIGGDVTGGATGGSGIGGTAGLDTGGGTMQVAGNVTLTADGVSGSNPAGTTAPTVAGLLKIGNGSASPGGTLSVGGSLAASAVGDVARAGGQSLLLRTADASLAVAGDTTITVTGNADFNVLGTGSFDTGGALAINSIAGQITGTGLLTSGGNMLISGTKGIALDRLTSGGTTGLFSTIGPVTVADLLSTGPVTVSGLSASIGSSGSLTFANADATGGDLLLDAAGNLTLNGAASATGLLGLTAGQTIFVNAAAVGSQISATSQDIVINSGSQIGRRGTTATVAFINSNGGNTSYIGGGTATGGYSLDNAELQQVFADNAIAFAVQAGSGTGEVAVGTLDLGFGATGAIGTGGALSLATYGRILVVGDVTLTTSSAADAFNLTAGSVEVSTDAGSIGLGTANGTRLGQINVTANRFITATSDTIALLDPNLGLDQISALLDQPGIGPARGGLFAGTITANVTEGIYIQNLGSSTAFADRRGFTAGSLAINTASKATRIAINGITIDANGNAVVGLDTVSTITINGTPAAPGGRFNPFSSVNGCIIGFSCISSQPENGIQAIPRSKPDIETPVTTGTTLAGLLSPPTIQIDVNLPQLERDTSLPLVDEPVTGVGNEDLWGDSCSSEGEGCSGGQTK
jgi:filamentous hemagglutinin family protein